LDPAAAFERLSPRLTAEPAPARTMLPAGLRPGLRLIIALQFCAIAALAWTTWTLHPTAVVDAGPAYRGLAASAANGDAVVIFAADATADQVREALQRANARIVDGPSAAGAYVLRFEHGTAEAAITSLGRERAVVRVESLAAVAQPPRPSARP
jgi:hypothetical protein